MPALPSLTFGLILRWNQTLVSGSSCIGIKPAVQAHLALEDSRYCIWMTFENTLISCVYQRRHWLNFPLARFHLPFLPVSLRGSEIVQHHDIPGVFLRSHLANALPPLYRRSLSPFCPQADETITFIWRVRSEALCHLLSLDEPFRDEEIC